MTAWRRCWMVSVHLAEDWDVDDVARCLCELRPTGNRKDMLNRAWQERDESRYRTVVAVIEGRVVGTATLVLERKLLGDGLRAGHIQEVAVLADHQGKGVGKALVEWCKNEARRMGCYKVMLECLPERVGFYERLGFSSQEVSLRVNF